MPSLRPAARYDVGIGPDLTEMRSSWIKTIFRRLLWGNTRLA
jgi:hypothetical protein